MNFLFCLFFAFIHFGFFGPSTLLVADIILHLYHLKSRSRCFVLVQQQFGKTEWTPEETIITRRMKTSISKEVWCLWNKLLQKRESLLRAKATTADEKFSRDV